MTSPKHATSIHPGSFEPYRHWYDKALNATIHPMIHFFLNLKQDRMISRYCHLHPVVDPEKLRSILNYKIKYFPWSGADLINVTNAGGKKQMVVIENNSCPSGQKSMPLIDDSEEMGGYKILIEETFKPFMTRSRPSVQGDLAVIYDKNEMEAGGYAEAMAEIFDEDVWLVPYYNNDNDPPVKYNDGVIYVRDEKNEWHPIRAAFRYLTQKPWNRLSLHSKTRLFNPIVACLAGGRNKLMAAKAYDFLNGGLNGSGLKIIVPETIRDMSKSEIPLWIRRLGGQAVIKIPYSNAGQGVFTIVNKDELDEFMNMDFEYDKFIIQSLIGNYNWSSRTSGGKLYHVGTIPTSKGHTYVADLRMMIRWTPEGIRPLCVYSRRAEEPLPDHLEPYQDSWEILGTNLSFKNEDGTWGSDTKRLLLMDRRDFNKLGLGLDDLIEAFIQTVLSTVAIDKLASSLYNSKGKFRERLFRSLNDDETLIAELMK